MSPSNDDNGERRGREMGHIRARLDQVERELENVRDRVHRLSSSVMVGDAELTEKMARIEAAQYATAKDLQGVEGDVHRTSDKIESCGGASRDRIHKVERDLEGIKARLVTWTAVASAVGGIILWVIRTGIQHLSE